MGVWLLLIFPFYIDCNSSREGGGRPEAPFRPFPHTPPGKVLARRWQQVIGPVSCLRLARRLSDKSSALSLSLSLPLCTQVDNVVMQSREHRLVNLYIIEKLREYFFKIKAVLSMHKKVFPVVNSSNIYEYRIYLKFIQFI